jgi:23S rRNA pseudouridine1911/1915/1917 synthase
MNFERIDVQVRERTRLDVFLTRRLPGVSRSRVQRHIRAGDVLVDGQTVRPNHMLLGGEVLQLPPFAARREALASAAVEFRIVYEDAEIVVVDKPAGLIVHPVGREYRNTLLNGLHHRLRARGEDSLELGIVHRLDRLTSGLLVVAKTLVARRALSEAIENRAVHRAYVAIAAATPRQARGSIDFAIRRDPTRPTRMQALTAEELAGAQRDIGRGHVSASGYSDPRLDVRPRRARTRWSVLRRLPQAAILRFELETGRTHQIRVHAHKAGLALIGDPLYGPDPHDRRHAAVTAVHAALGRPALHAAQLAFTHPRQGTRLCFRAPLPADMRWAIAQLASVTS